MKRPAFIPGLLIFLVLCLSNEGWGGQGEPRMVVVPFTNTVRPVRVSPVLGPEVHTVMLDTNQLKALRVEASADRTNGRAPLPVTFSAVVFPPSARDSTRARYQWSFGDGVTADRASVQHTYTQPGTYAATVTYTRFVTDPRFVARFTERTEQVSNTLLITVTAPPREPIPATLGVTPMEIHFQGEPGGAPPNAVPVQLSNSGSKGLRWAAGRPSESWLKLSPASGMLPPGGNTQLLATVVTSGLSAGSYQAEAAIGSRQADTPPLKLVAYLNLTAPAEPAAPATNPARSAPSRPTPFWPWAAVVSVLGLGVGFALGRIFPPRPPAVIIEIRPFLSQGAERVKTPGSIVVPFPRVRLFCDPPDPQIKVRGHLIGSITKLEKRGL